MTTGTITSPIFQRQSTPAPSASASNPPSTRPPGQPACSMFSHLVLSWRYAVAMSGLTAASTAPLPSESTNVPMYSAQ